MTLEIRQLRPDDITLMEALLGVFGGVFDEMETYTENKPGADYLRNLLGGEAFIAFVALKDGEVVAGITAYELKKYEQARSEIYIYDLAVSAAHRREGIATALILAMKSIAVARGAYVVIIQADTGVEDQPAIALYTRLGVCAKVLHFDIAVDDEPSAAE